MSSHKKARHKLSAHDAGNDRHNKGLSWIKKQRRLEIVHQRQNEGVPKLRDNRTEAKTEEEA